MTKKHKKPPKVAFIVRIPVELLEKVKVVAERDNRSANSLVVLVLQKHFGEAA